MKKLLIALAVFFLCITGAIANKTTVEINAPDEVAAGTEITITISISHNGNSKAHHTEWVFLTINGKEVQRWEYTKTELPPGNEFTLEYKMVATEPLTIEAQGNCNMHGSTGLKTKAIITR
jgi:desulfoferrodoxin (superoxide reductase-like protein)